MRVRLFITATDTGAGKTYVTTALICALQDAGKDVIALKPVACGNGGEAINPDVAALLKAQGLPERDVEKINLYSFDAALAPSQAAAEEGRKIDPKELIDWCSEQSKGHEICLIEGVGGLMVPLAEWFLVADWLAGAILGPKHWQINCQWHPAFLYLVATSCRKPPPSRSGLVVIAYGLIQTWMISDCEINFRV